MKLNRVTALFLGLVLAFSLAACGQGASSASTASSAASCGPALRAAGHGAHRPDCGGILFLKKREDYFVRQLDKTLTIRE